MCMCVLNNSVVSIAEKNERTMKWIKILVWNRENKQHAWNGTISPQRGTLWFLRRWSTTAVFKRKPKFSGPLSHTSLTAQVWEFRFQQSSLDNLPKLHLPTLNVIPRRHIIHFEYLMVNIYVLYNIRIAESAVNNNNNKNANTYPPGPGLLNQSV